MSKGNDFGSQWREVFACFEQWQQAALEDREALLDRLRQSRPEVHARVVSMIRADEAAEEHSFMADSALDHVASGSTSRWTGTSLGPWVLREVIGTGGMGQVWLATRGDSLYRGRAAVKMLHLENATAEANARFAREGELLARMAHPRIAQLYDAGITAAGTRYLVLEYIEGKPLDEACDSRCLSIQDRLALFLQVCEAVAYAHQQHVVHRDLKPSNILVTGDGHVKLLDFGVAKLMGSDGPAPELTRLGAQWLTLEYAAPEQIEQGNITTATDVYSLGVLLYSLLCGSRPNAHVRTLSDAVRYLEAPLRPMQQSAAQSNLAEVAAKRSLPPARLAADLRGDLAVIVAKALKVEASERYDTAQALGDDLRRYLRQQPVLAQRDSWRYRAKKFIQRNRAQTAAAAGVLLALVLGLASTLWQWREAVREGNRATSAIDLLTESFTPADLGKSDGSLASLVDVLNRAWQQTGQRFAAEPDTKAKLALPLGLMLSSAGEMATAAEALEVSRQHHLAAGLPPTRQYVTMLLLLGTAQARMLQLDEAKLRLNEVIQTGARIGGKDLDEPLIAEIQLALIARQEGRMGEARQQLEAALRKAGTTFGNSHETTVLARQELTSLLQSLGEQPAELEPATQRSSSDPKTTAFNEFLAAQRDVEEGRFAAAVLKLEAVIPKLTALLSATDTQAIFARAWLSAALLGAGQHQRSEATVLEAERLAAQSKDPIAQPNIAIVLARHYLRTRQPAKARPYLERSLGFFAGAGPAGRHTASVVQAQRGEYFLRSDRVAQGLRSLEQARAEQRAIAGDAEYLRESYPTLTWYAIAQDVTAGAAAAAPHYEEAQAAAARFRIPEHPDRVRLQLLVDYVTWRSAPSADTRARLLESVGAYKKVLQPRADFATFSVIENELLQTAATTRVFDNLLSLMSY